MVVEHNSMSGNSSQAMEIEPNNSTYMGNGEHEPEENSPVKQVALTVSTTDDESLPVLTFRMWVLGTLSCVLLSFLNQFFGLRREPLTVSAISAQIAVVPLGKLMAATITDRVFFKGTRLEFTLNPGPFNIKEHFLITIFAKKKKEVKNAHHVHVLCVLPCLLLIVTSVKVFYHKHNTFCVLPSCHNNKG